MAANKTAVSPLLTELFRYTPLTFLDDVINTVNELTYRAVDAVEEGLLSTPPSSLGFHDAENRDGQSQAKTEIEHGVHQLETLLQASVDKNFDKLEIYVLRNVMALKDPELEKWIELPHYEGLDFSPVTPDEPTKESIVHLRRQYTESRKLNVALDVEKKRNEKLLSDLHSLVDASSDDASSTSLSFLFNGTAKQDLSQANSLSSQSRQLVQALPKLQSLISVLRAHLASPSASNPQARPGASAAGERTDYIEEAVRRRVVQALPGADPITGEGLSGDVSLITSNAGGSMDVGAIEDAANLLEQQKDHKDKR